MTQDSSSAEEEHDGCSFLCPKILKSDTKSINDSEQTIVNRCLFERLPIQFENIIKLSQMSLIHGLTDTLFDEFCKNSRLNRYQFVYTVRGKEDSPEGPFTDWSPCCRYLIQYYDFKMN